MVLNTIHLWLQSATHQCIPGPFQLQPPIMKMARDAFPIEPYMAAAAQNTTPIVQDSNMDTLECLFTPQKYNKTQECGRGDTVPPQSRLQLPKFFMPQTDVSWRKFDQMSKWCYKASMNPPKERQLQIFARRASARAARAAPRPAPYMLMAWPFGRCLKRPFPRGRRQEHKHWY
jgi:hypothetical protein